METSLQLFISISIMDTPKESQTQRDQNMIFHPKGEIYLVHPILLNSSIVHLAAWVKFIGITHNLLFQILQILPLK